MLITSGFKASPKISTDLDNLYTVWKPFTHRFQKCKILFQFFHVMSCHVAQRIVNWYFLWVLQHENRVTWEKKLRSTYFLAYCFINSLVNDLLHTAPYVIYRWRNALEKILTTSNFRSTSAVTVEVSKYIEAKNLSGICCTVVDDHT